MVGKHGPEFFDDPAVFATYHKGRNTPQSANETLERPVIKYHRTIEDYFTGLRRAGFSVDAVRESRPQRDLFADLETYQRRMRIPLMLFFSAVHPET